VKWTVCSVVAIAAGIGSSSFARKGLPVALLAVSVSVSSEPFLPFSFQRRTTSAAFLIACRDRPWPRCLVGGHSAW
jgi:hypothetical protein